MQSSRLDIFFTFFTYLIIQRVKNFIGQRIIHLRKRIVLKWLTINYKSQDCVLKIIYFHKTKIMSTKQHCYWNNRRLHTNSSIPNLLNLVFSTKCNKAIQRWSCHLFELVWKCQFIVCLCCSNADCIHFGAGQTKTTARIWKHFSIRCF